MSNFNLFCFGFFLVKSKSYSGKRKHRFTFFFFFLAQPQKWRIKGRHRVNYGKCTVPSTTWPSVTVCWAFKGKNKIKSYFSSSLIQYPWRKVPNWQEGKWGWALERIRCVCSHKISVMRENQFNGTSNFISISKYVSF